MELELAITSYQRLSPTVTSSKRLSSSHNYVLGRAKDCDWYLPDPDRAVSSRHAEIFYREGQFWLKDISTNGVFVNGAIDALGKGKHVELTDGVTLRFGDYEIGVRQFSGAPQLEESTSNTIAAICGVVGGGGSTLRDLADPQSMGINPRLTSGLDEQRLEDSHVEIPDVAIPPVWHWGAAPATDKATAPAPDDSDDGLAALFDGLGMPHLATGPASPSLFRELGELTRLLLENLLGLLHIRAQQKQKLRVQQTLFQRSENNPLKFSVTAQDAIDALLVRRHSSFLGPAEAVEAAFIDIQQHERALMAGVEQLISELLQDPAGTEDCRRFSRLPLIRKARTYDLMKLQRTRQREELGDSDRMLRSDAFIEAYDSAVRAYEQERQR